MIVDFSASIVTGGGIRARVENARSFYAEDGMVYFNDILGKRGKAFADSACGFLLLDSLLQKHKINRAELVITLDPSGRPRTNRADLDFSISHSEGCTMCVLAIGEGANVGIDVQRERPYSLEKMVELAGTFMNDKEFAEFNSPTASKKPIPLISYDRDMEDFIQKNREFYTAWTRRESYTKRIGSDIFANLKTAKIDGEHYRDGVINACGESYYYSICAPREAFEEDSVEDFEKEPDIEETELIEEQAAEVNE